MKEEVLVPLSPAKKLCNNKQCEALRNVVLGFSTPYRICISGNRKKEQQLYDNIRIIYSQNQCDMYYIVSRLNVNLADMIDINAYYLLPNYGI